VGDGFTAGLRETILADQAEAANRRRRLPRLRVRLRELYHGDSAGAVRFRLWVIAIDFLLIGFFIAAPFLRDYPVYLVVDYAVAFILALDIGARALADTSVRMFARRFGVWVDVFVLITLLFPLALFNLAFLRVLRLWSLFHSEIFWDTIGRRYDDSRVEDVTKSLATLVTFIFVATGFVYASFARTHPELGGYVDALYFTVTTLTTTGFGDITLPGVWGRLLTIVIMISGITLFVRFAQTLIRPYKVRFTCPECGLMRHDPDAVHCKACGILLNIPNEE
jgi:voltage-gated potassium channel